MTRRAAVPVSDRSSGFTLLEMLVALAILAVLTTLLAGALHLGAGEIAQRTGRSSRADGLAAAYRMFRTELAGARPVVPINMPGNQIVFDGRRDGVEFAAPAPRAVGSGGIQLLSIDFIGGKLRARWQPYDGVIPVVGGRAATTVLIDRLRQVRFRYFGTLAPSVRPAWHDSWRDQAKLPALVQLELTFFDGGAVPPLLAAPRLQTPLSAGPEMLTGSLQ